MTSRSPQQGYLAETTYPDRFYRELAPVWLNYVAAVNGTARVRPLALPFSYLELGSGFSRTIIVNAAAYPHAEFHACDLNPQHIEAARAHAARLGIENLELHQLLFAQLLDAELPAFDFIVLHGVYSWVNGQVRQTVQELIRRKLKPGGLVYVSYNCLPGWTAESPLRTLLVELAAAQSGQIEQRIEAALDSLETLATPSFKYFRDQPDAISAVQAYRREPSDYLAHEFLNETWKLHYSIHVLDDMAEAGLAYVGSASLAHNHPRLLIDQSAAEQIAKLPSARVRQLALDFAVNQRFRRDVFVKREGDPLTPVQILQQLDACPVGCLDDLGQLSTEAPIPRGKIGFQPEFIAALRAVLAEGAVSLGSAVAQLGGDVRAATDIRQNIVFLIAAGMLAPFAHAARGGPTRRIESEAALRSLQAIVDAGTTGIVPSIHVGNGVTISPEEAAATLEAIANDAARVPARIARLQLLHG